MRGGEDRLRGRAFLQLSKIGISFFALHPAYRNFAKTSKRPLLDEPAA
jgi:hypothetical protein